MLLDNYNALSMEAIELCQANFTCRGTLKDDATILNFAYDSVYQIHGLNDS